MYVHHHVCAGAYGGQKRESVGSPGSRVRDVCEAPCGC